MNASVTNTDELDLEISFAYITLGGARTQLARSPNGDNQRRVAEAEAELDRLLDQRLDVTRPTAAA